MTNLERGDIRYYWQLHVKKKKAQWENPVTYSSFRHRLSRMNLHDAIEKDRVEYNVRDWKSKTPIQDEIRRKQINKEENISILDLDELVKIEEERIPVKKWSRYMIPKPKPTLWKRFISLFK